MSGTEIFLLLLKPRRQQRGAGVVLVPFYDLQIKNQIAHVDVQVNKELQEIWKTKHTLFLT